MPVLKIRDENGNWIPIPNINTEVNEASIRGAIPSLIKCIGGANSPLVTLDGESIPIGRVSTGSYVGTGVGVGASVSLTFDFEPQLILVCDTKGVLVMVRPNARGISIWSTSINNFPTYWTDDGVSYSTVYDWAMNTEGTTYNYVAIGLG